MNFRLLKTITALLVITGLLLPSVSYALLGDLTIKAECKLKSLLKDKITWLVKRIIGFLEDVFNAALQFFTFGFAGEEKVKDKVVRELLGALKGKELVADVYARCYAKGILERAVNGILDTVRKRGRDGTASYVQNWRNFQTNAQYRGEAVFRSILANTKVCNYLESDIRQVFGVTNKSKTSLAGQNIRVGDLDPFTLRAKCTLPDNFSVEKYRQDFKGNGGWDAFLRLMQPQNNFYGLLLESTDELEKQRALEISSDLNQAAAGDGYLGITGDNANDSCAVRADTGRCLFYKNIKTPGQTLSSSVAATIKAELDWVTSVDEMNELLGDISGRIIGRLRNLLAPDTKVPVEIDPDPDEDYPERTPYPSPGTSPTPTTTTGPTPTPTSTTTPNPGCVETTVLYEGDVASAIDTLVATQPGLFNPSRESRGGGTPIGPGAEGTMSDLEAYKSALNTVLQGRGYTSVNHPTDSFAIALWKTNNFRETYKISYSWFETRHAYSDTCSPAQF